MMGWDGMDDATILKDLSTWEFNPVSEGERERERM
jgi:hypothetical protein